MSENNIMNKEWIKNNLISLAVSQDLAITKKQADSITENLIESFVANLKDGKEFKLRGFGGLKYVVSKERMGRNPKTGEPVKIPARKVLKFKAAKDTIMEG